MAKSDLKEVLEAKSLIRRRSKTGPSKHLGEDMLGWLWRHIVGTFHVCNHKFEEVARHDITTYGKLTNELYILRCAHCGEMKRYKAQG